MASKYRRQSRLTRDLAGREELDNPDRSGTTDSSSPQETQWTPFVDSAAAPETERPSVGEIVAGRFQILSVLGRGGMGLVYRARDCHLEVDVALKAVRSELSNDPRALEYFRTEARLARQVTHRNVCRIYDVFVHRNDAGQEASFLAMELLAGETLAARLRRVRRLPLAETLSCLAQIGAGLDAAHRAGVLHLDLKSNNVFLVGAPEGERVVVGDFGLCRAIGEAAHDLPTRRTQPHLAPERWQATQVSVATDVYALAALAYQLLSGRKVQVDRDSRPVLFNLTARQRRVLTRALDPDPHLRPKGTIALAGAVSEASLPTPVHRLLTRTWHVTLLAAALLAGNPASPPSVGLPSAVILNAPGISTDPLLAEVDARVANTLAAIDQFTVLSGRRVDQMRAALGGQHCSDRCLDSVAQRLGASSSLSIAIEPLGKSAVRLSMGARIAGLRRTVEVSEVGARHELGVLVERSVEELAARLGLPMPNRHALAAVRSLLPSSPAGLRYFVSGSRSLDWGDAKGAARSFKESIREEPAFPMSHLGLGDALTQLGFHERAAAEYRAALPFASGIPHRELLLIEGRAHQAEMQWDAAAAVYLSLWSAFRWESRFGVALAEVQANGGHCGSALRTVDSLRQGNLASIGESSDAQLDITEGLASTRCSDWPRVRRAARHAIQLGLLQASPTVVATGRQELGQALAETGQYAEGQAELKRSIAIAERTGDIRLIFAAQRELATLARDRGDLPEAEKYLLTMRDLARSMGDPIDEAICYRSLGMLYKRLGRINDAIGQQLKARAIFGNTGERRMEGLTLNSLGLIAEDRNDIRGADALYREALAIVSQTDDRQALGALLVNFARSRWALGDGLGAEKSLLRGSAILASTEDSLAADALGDLAALEIDMGNLAEAESILERVEATSKPRPATVGWLLLVRGRLASERDNSVEADSLTKQAIDIFRRTHEKGGEGAALTQLSLLALDHGSAADARRDALAADAACRSAHNIGCANEASLAWAASALRQRHAGKAQELIRQSLQSPDLLTSLHARRLQAELMTVTGLFSAAERQFLSVASDAGRGGFVLEAATADLALGEMLQRNGRGDEGHRLLLATATNCQARKLTRLTHRAENHLRVPEPAETGH
jgi:serine/threonine protein kinase/tetratricopeptide (TPR) repeat protein